MLRTVLNARLHLLGLLLAWSGWMITTGLLTSRLTVAIQQTGSVPFDHFLAAAFSAALGIAAWTFLYSQLPGLARIAKFWPVRVVGLAGAVGVAGFVLGFAARSSPPLCDWLSGADLDRATIRLRGAFGIIGFFLLALSPRGESAAAPFFLTNRNHASDGIARKSLIAAAGHALFVALACDVAIRFPMHADSAGAFPRVLGLGAIAYIAGIVLAVWQRYPQRAVGLLPVGGVLATIGMVAAWISPSAEWPVLLLGLALGLGHTPPRNDLLANIPPGQQIPGLLLMALAQGFGVAIGVELMSFFPGDAARPIRLVLAILLTSAAAFGYLRELIESIVEVILAVTNPIRAYGPGLKGMPTRGPILVMANHGAWFDPLWLAKVIPFRMRPMMTSRFYDKPFISWLMRVPFRAIRVPDSGFRRETPELQEVVAALDRGENVLIFPEGWLRRREDRSLRRFGQGVYQILRELPRTPVVVCWIEGNWGSYTSFWNGPPTVNKKPDLFRRIRIGVSEPEVLSIEMLHDQLATRRYLMQKCLHARTFIGLPELPAPPFAAEDDADEQPPQKSD
jgi:1-acyl-sn-glycerol-3-phosphate acyltransferase